MFFIAAVLIWILMPGVYALSLARARVRHTTLNRAWWWWVISGLIFAAAVLVSALSDAAGVADQLWYLSSVLFLCPLMSALGARRPGDVAWVFFVIVPMVLVLEWPAVSMMVTSDIDEPLILQTPAVIGVFLVLLMGAGNYLGTRFTWAAMLFAAADICFVVSVCDLRPERITAMRLRYIGCLPLGLAIGTIIISLRRWNRSELGFTRVWWDFRDSFGIVWSRRVAERFNLMAKREKLGLRIRFDGPVDENVTVAMPTDNSAKRSSPDESEPVDSPRSDLPRFDSPREEQILRWILKRFVDDEWLNTRFGCSRKVVDPTFRPR